MKAVARAGVVILAILAGASCTKGQSASTTADKTGSGGDATHSSAQSGGTEVSSTSGSQRGGAQSNGSGGAGGGASAATGGANGSSSGGAIASGGASGGANAGGGAASGGATSGGQTSISGGASTGGSTTSGSQPYANVVAVATSGSAGSYTFNVSVESSDIDCNQFCNWWEVLGEDGSLIFRRILQHCHTDDNGTSDPGAPGNTFTRDGSPVNVTADQVVIVRGHMNTGGYHGQVMRGSVSAGFEVASDIGDDFAPAVESADPQPTGCLF